ncbi:MAG: EI24 domain-containing protein, partial [Paracoccaceae bacterium]
MILSAFAATLGQLDDRRFLRVIGLGCALAAGLLLGTYGILLLLIDWFSPDSLTLPWIGEVGGLKGLLDIGSLLLMITLSIVLMVPVAALFSGLFLEDVAQAVEDRHYPGLPPAQGPGMALALIGS